MPNNELIKSLKRRDCDILSKYCIDDIDVNDVKIIYTRKLFLTLSDKLLEILYRNIKYVPHKLKTLPFYYDIVTTFVYMYCDIHITPIAPEMGKDIGIITLSKFFCNHYDVIAKLPTSQAEDTLPWVGDMKKMLDVFEFRGVTLATILEKVANQLYGEEMIFMPASIFSEYVLQDSRHLSKFNKR